MQAHSVGVAVLAFLGVLAATGWSVACWVVDPDNIAGDQAIPRMQLQVVSATAANNRAEPDSLLEWFGEYPQTPAQLLQERFDREDGVGIPEVICGCPNVIPHEE